MGRQKILVTGNFLPEPLLAELHLLLEFQKKNNDVLTQSRDVVPIFYSKLISTTNINMLVVFSVGVPPLKIFLLLATLHSFSAGCAPMLKPHNAFLRRLGPFSLLNVTLFKAVSHQPPLLVSFCDDFLRFSFFFFGEKVF